MIKRFSNDILNLFRDRKTQISKQILQVNEDNLSTRKLSFRSPTRRIRLRNLFVVLGNRFLSRPKIGIEITQLRFIYQPKQQIWIYFPFHKRLRKNIFLIVIFFALSISNGFSQSNRSTLNDGVDKYEEKKFTEAEVDFRKVVENSPKNFEANFNLGTSYYKQEKYEDAIKSFQSAFENAKDGESRGKVFHNIGNSLIKSNKIEQSIEAYKNALKFNPNDQDTKYNLSYALEMLKNKDKDKNKQDKNDQNKDNKDKQDQQNKDQEKQDQQQNPQPQDQESKQDNTKQPQQPKEVKISKDEAQRILDALKNNEKDLQKQLRKKTGKVKKTDKDW